MYFNYLHHQHNQSLFKYRNIWSRKKISESQCKKKTSCAIAKWNQLVSFLDVWIFLAHTFVIECKHKQTFLTVYFTTGSKTYLEPFFTDNFWYFLILYCYCWELLIFTANFTIVTNNCRWFWYLLMFLQRVLIITEMRPYPLWYWGKVFKAFHCYVRLVL